MKRSKLIYSRRAIAVAFFVLSLLLLGGTSVPQVTADPPPVPQCRVFCFRITDIRCDDEIANRYHFEFEVLNWSNAYAGGVKLVLSNFSAEGIEFSPAFGDGIDADGRPLIWEDVDGNGVFQGDSGDLEDRLVPNNGILDDGEDRNGNFRLDNDPIPGNLRRNNTWILATQTNTTMLWNFTSEPIPFINLVDSANCTECILALPRRDGPDLIGIDANGNMRPLDYVDNGDNVQDGFVMTIDGLEPGKAAHLNWFLLGAGGAQITPEDEPALDCRVGANDTVVDVDVGVEIGTVARGNSYGFGLISLTRLDTQENSTLPGGTFVGQTGFRQSATEFFDGVYNVPASKNATIGQCGTFGMEFTPAQSCADGNNAGNCVPIDTNGGGDPHFTTWSGEHFNFHGECDVVLIRNPSFGGGVGMHVHGRTKLHDNAWSDFESAAIKINNDVFEARGNYEYWVNGQPNATLPATIGGYQVTLQEQRLGSRLRVFVIHLGGQEEIHFKAFESMMWVQVKGQQAHDFMGSDGMFGHYGNGRKLSRNGTEIKHPNRFGREWQVRPGDDPVLFHAVEGPQYPKQKCKLPGRRRERKIWKLLQQQRGGTANANKEVERRLENDRAAARLAVAKKACSHAPAQEIDDCVADVVATNNVDLATAY